MYSAYRQRQPHESTLHYITSAILLASCSLEAFSGVLIDQASMVSMAE